MPICFVMQPFDGGPFDKRYEDILVPAITDANLEPYRVDRDPSVSIPIEDIENGIRRADACLADISEPNPNVWFELGYAIATAKPVVLICSHKPDRRFPFDVQHRSIITYKLESARDFSNLKEQITAKLQAALQKEDELGKLAGATVLADIEGLTQLEIATLAAVAQNTNGPEDDIAAWAVKKDMEKMAYTQLAATLGFTSLREKGMISAERRQDHDGEYYTVLSVTHQGYQWLFANRERLALRHNEAPGQVEPITEDDIPF